jgi:hypothetical protein
MNAQRVIVIELKDLFSKNPANQILPHYKLLVLKNEILTAHHTENLFIRGTLLDCLGIFVFLKTKVRLLENWG